MAIDLAPRPWIGSIAASFDPAISYSTSVRMSGDRVASFRRLGAQVVAAEPQPAAARVLRLLYGRSRGVAIETIAVGRAAGTIDMMINPDNPTVSTVSNEMVTAAREAPGWETQRWSRAIRVPVTNA